MSNVNDKEYHAQCGNSSFAVWAENAQEALDYAVSRFDNEMALTSDVTVTAYSSEYGFDYDDRFTFHVNFVDF